MIVCSCHVVSDHDIRQVFAGPERPRTMSQVYRSLGHEPHCGRCVRSVRELMGEHGHDRNKGDM